MNFIDGINRKLEQMMAEKCPEGSAREVVVNSVTWIGVLPVWVFTWVISIMILMELGMPAPGELDKPARFIQVMIVSTLLTILMLPVTWMMMFLTILFTCTMSGGTIGLYLDLFLWHGSKNPDPTFWLTLLGLIVGFIIDSLIWFRGKWLEHREFARYLKDKDDSGQSILNRKA